MNRIPDRIQKVRCYVIAFLAGGDMGHLSDRSQGSKGVDLF